MLAVYRGLHDMNDCSLVMNAEIDIRWLGELEQKQCHLGARPFQPA